VTDWDRIVREHGAAVFGTAWRILGHVADTEDVVQEVFLQVYRMQATQPVRHWAGLLRQLAACRALDRLRKRRGVVSLNGMHLSHARDNPEDTAIEHELTERLRQAIARLPGREAEVFCLRYFEEYSYQQIASTLDINPGAVAAALHKARAKLEVMLGECVHEKC
jgi:RNA polymerase sigma-70 factor, ECF subfamily